jgi:predicted Zn-dependent protease with MMP-like domain
VDSPPRRRDRHGRGARRDLVPAGLPGHRTRAQRFDDLVLDAVERLEERWEAELRDVEFAVEDVPPAPAAEPVADPRVELDPAPLALAHTLPAGGRGAPPRIVLYRRPIEARARDPLDLADLVFDVVVHELADLLGLEPETIDPEGHGAPE